MSARLIHDTPVSSQRACAAIAAAACLCTSASAQPVPVTIDASSLCWCRTTLAGRASPWTAAAFQASMEVGAPSGGGAGQVVIRNLHITVPSASALIIIPPTGQVTPHAANLALTVAPTDFAIAGQSGAPGQTLFASSSPPCVMAGVIDYAATGYSCTTLQSGGAPCSGAFNLAVPGLVATASISSGTIDTSVSPASVSLTMSASAPLMPGTSWGKVDVWGILHGTLAAPPSQTCPADFNGVGGVSVGDIFDFLAAWFASAPRADFNHIEGVNVRDIFDFLAAWFAGC